MKAIAQVPFYVCIFEDIRKQLLCLFLGIRNTETIIMHGIIRCIKDKMLIVCSTTTAKHKAVLGKGVVKSLCLECKII